MVQGLIKDAKQPGLTNGLHYKHVTIVNDDSSIISKWSFKLVDNPRVVIYDHHRFIIQATSPQKVKQKLVSNIMLCTYNV